MLKAALKQHAPPIFSALKFIRSAIRSSGIMIETLLKQHAPPLFQALKFIEFASSALRILPVRRYSRIPTYSSLFQGVEAEVKSGSTNKEMLTVAASILGVPSSVDGVFVEAGSWKGASAARLSLACADAGRRMVIFDSFEGIPPNAEDHGKNIWGYPAEFPEGAYAGSLDEVKSTITHFGRIDVCSFHKGWFEATLPSFKEPVVGAYLDVDLESSTRTCLKYLYPLLQPGGFIYSQDGHLPLVIQLLKDEAFWRDEIGVEPPPIEELGERKLVKIVKR